MGHILERVYEQIEETDSTNYIEGLAEELESAAQMARDRVTELNSVLKVPSFTVKYNSDEYYSYKPYEEEAFAIPVEIAVEQGDGFTACLFIPLSDKEETQKVLEKVLRRADGKGRRIELVHDDENAYSRAEFTITLS